MNSFIRQASMFVLVALIPLTKIAAFADSPQSPNCTSTLTFEEFRAQAFARSPLVAQIDENFADTVARAQELKTLRNPELQIGVTETRMELNGDNDGQVEAALSQPLRLSDFGARNHIASLLDRSGDLERRASLLQLSIDLQVKFAALSAYERTDGMLSEAEGIAQRRSKLIQEGVQKGLFSDGDEQLFVAERYRLQSLREGTKLALSRLRHTLSETMLSTCDIHTSAAGAVHPLPDEQTVLAKALANPLSEIARTRILNSVAQEQLRLEELDATPSITPRLIYQHTNDGGDFYGVGITIPLPVFDRNQAAIIRARARQSTTEARSVLHSEAGIERRVRYLYAATQAAIRQSQIFSDHVIPALKKALQTQEQHYRLGKGDALRSWQTLREYSEAQRQSIHLELEAHSLQAQLSALTGEEL